MINSVSTYVKFFNIKTIVNKACNTFINKAGSYNINESKIEKAVSEYATANGILNYKFLSTHNGVPDRIFIAYPNTVFFIEFKKLGEKPRKLQEIVMSKIRSKGVEVFVVDNIEKGKRLIDKKK